MPLDNSGRTHLRYACSSGYNSMGRYLVNNFSCKPDDPDFNGYTSVHAACEAGCMHLVRYFLVDLKCNAQAEMHDLKTLLYFASKSLNVELIQFLHDKFNLKPRLQDIEIAQSVNPDLSVVEYLQKIYDTCRSKPVLFITSTIFFKSVLYSSQVHTLKFLLYYN